ncbi:MAG: Ig-like domain-containing protein [Erysipelotrichaceae bacterium]|nr:Ig-like domain-containing protein [Erysipelotrichaceae bacterium]
MKKRRTVFLVFILSLLMVLCGCAQSHTVNFNTDGGTFIEAETVKDGGKVTKPEDPVKEGYNFKEWQLNDAVYDFDTPVKEDIVLKAVYYSKVNTCTVIIEGKKYTMEFKDGETVSLENPTSTKGMNFVGWMVDGKLDDLSAVKDGSTVEAVFENAWIPCTKVYLPHKSYYTVEGTGSWKLDVIVEPADTNDKVIFKVDDESVVKVDEDGYIHAGKVGKTKVHITCGDQEFVIDFETRAKKVSVTSVTVTPAAIMMYGGNTEKLTVEVSPKDATDNTVTFKSNDTSVATVSSEGVITAKGPGLAKITVTAGGISAECEVCVEGEDVIFSMQNNVVLKEASGQKVPYKATHISCYDWSVNKEDVTLEAEFHTAYTSALKIDGNGNVYAAGYVYQSVDIPVYFTWNDGSSLNVRSADYIIRVEK